MTAQDNHITLSEKNTNLIDNSFRIFLDAIEKSFSCDNEIINRSIFHIVFDSIGFLITLGNEKGQLCSKYIYTRFVEQYLIQEFYNQKRHCSKCFKKDDIIDAFWNDRCAKLHTSGSISIDYKKETKMTKPTIEIEGYTKDALKNFGKKNAKQNQRLIIPIVKNEFIEDIKSSIENSQQDLKSFEQVLHTKLLSLKLKESSKNQFS